MLKKSYAKFKWHECGLSFRSPHQLTHFHQADLQLNDVPGLLAPAINSAALAEIPSEAKLCPKLSRPLVLEVGSRPEGVLGPEDLLRCCLTEAEAEVQLQIIPKPDCTRVVLVNLVLLELDPPPLC